MQTTYKTIVIILILFFVFGLGIGVGYGVTTYLNAYETPSEEMAEDFSLFWEVWNIVGDKFYGGTPDSDIVTYGAIRGALATLEDPYTIFVEPQPRELERDALAGQFGGIGAYVKRNEEDHVILDPMPDSPSAKAGLFKDDILIKVDDTDIVPDMTTDEVVLLIRGKVGTEVSLTVTREDSPEPIVLVIERAIIETPSMEWRISEEDANIGYVRIWRFTNRTNDELGAALEELQQNGAEKYILDLRGNGGGLLQSAKDVSSHFLNGEIILKEDRRGQSQKTHKASRGGTLLEEPLVLLVDGGSASASEIVAGALQDYGRAVLIGERTYGKGSVQLVYDLPDGSSLHITVAKWFTPDDHSIDRTGLSPDFEVLFTEEDHAQQRDPQYIRAVEFLQMGE